MAEDRSTSRGCAPPAMGDVRAHLPLTVIIPIMETLVQNLFPSTWTLSVTQKPIPLFRGLPRKLNSRFLMNGFYAIIMIPSMLLGPLSSPQSFGKGLRLGLQRNYKSMVYPALLKTWIFALQRLEAFLLGFHLQAPLQASRRFH